MKHIRALFISTNLFKPKKTGGEYYNYKIFEGLKEAEYDVDGFDLSDHLRMAKFRLISWLFLFRFRRYNFVFIDNTHFYFLFFMLSKLLGTQIICIFHHLNSQTMSGWRKYRMLLNEFLLLKIVTKAVFVSQTTMNDCVALGYSGKDHIIIHPGLDKNIWSDRTQLYNPDPIKCNILFVGHILERKGVMDLVKAFELWLEEAYFKERCLYLVGNDQADDNFTKQLLQYIHDRKLSSSVKLTGRVGGDELTNYFTDATVFVFPSYYEGYGIVLMEAASYGIPLVASDAGAIPETLKNGQYGFLHTTGDTESIVSSIKMTLRALNVQSKNSAKFYKVSNDWECVSESFNDFIKK